MSDQPVTRAELLEALTSTKQDILEALGQTLGEHKRDFGQTLAEHKRDFGQTLAELKRELDQTLAEHKREILEKTQEFVRDAQTEILRAFQPFEESSSIRMRVIEAKFSNTEMALNERLAIVERRLSEIEKKLLRNPPAA